MSYSYELALNTFPEGENPEVGQDCQEEQEQQEQTLRLEQSEHLRTVAHEVGAILLRAELPFRVWSGVQAGEIGGHRVSEDVDIWVLDSKIFLAFEHLGLEMNRPVKLEVLPDRTIIAVGENREVELMAHMDIHVGNGDVYPLRLTERVLASCPDSTEYAPSWDLPFARPEDTILLKAILQRGEEVGKHDAEDIIAMVRRLGGIDENYLWRRMADTGSAARALPYLYDLGVMDVVPRSRFDTAA